MAKNERVSIFYYKYVEEIKVSPAPSDKNLLLKGPRKSKCMAFYDRLVEGTTFEWTICNNGRAESEEAKGKFILCKIFKGGILYFCDD